ncbi:hypothetical protein CL655_01430 [bacterium]|nr:hypothetical protein [bacterium]|tara:strand:+ start:648 stop:974 length:327 start_codon:yes stop_codon:yes gene_type:complete
MFEGFFGPKSKSVEDAFTELQEGDESLRADLVTKAKEIQYTQGDGLPDHQRAYLKGLYREFDQLLDAAKITLKPARALHSEADPTHDEARTQLITKLLAEPESAEDTI